MNREAPYFVNGRIKWISEDEEPLDLETCAVCGKHLDPEAWWDNYQDFKDYIYEQYEENAPILPFNVCLSCGIDLYEDSENHADIGYNDWVY